MDKQLAARLASMNMTEGEGGDTGGGVEMIDMPGVVTKRVIGLKKLQEQADALDDEYKVERLQLEAKYRTRRQPLYDQRAQIVAGNLEPVLTAEEEAEIPANESTPEASEEIKGIPGFWGQCLTNNNLIGDFVTEEDIPALNYLADIKCTYNDEMSSFTLHFYFTQNPYFTDAVLTKTYNLHPDLLDEQAPSLSSIVGCEIHWNEAKNLTVGIVQKKQKGKSGKRKGQIRFVTREEPKASFFHFFGEPSEDEEEEEEEEEEPERIKFSIEEDYEVGHSIRTDIVPNAVLWFTGEAIDDEDDDEDDGEGDDEDDDDDDDDDDEGAGLVKNAKGGFSAPPGQPRDPNAPPGQPGAETPECKQN